MKLGELERQMMNERKNGYCDITMENGVRRCMQIGYFGDVANYLGFTTDSKVQSWKYIGWNI